MPKSTDDTTLTPEEHHAWNVACDAFARMLQLYRSENLHPRDMLLVAGFIVAHCNRDGDVHPAASAVLAIARRVLSENLEVFVARPNADTVVVTTTTRKPSDENN